MFFCLFSFFLQVLSKKGKNLMKNNP